MHADLDQQDLSIVPTGHHVRGAEFIMLPRAKRSCVDWAYQAYPDTLIPGGHQLDVPFRDPHFPIFWEVDRHPKLPANAIAEKCLVMLMKGHHIIELCWYIFAHNVQGTTKPEDNVLQVWVLDKSRMPTLVPAKFREMCDHNLGSRSRRMPNKPRHVKGQFTQDGIEWERHDLAKSINTNEWAYPMTLSFEQQHNLVGPCVETKICDDITVHNQMRAETAAADVGMCALDAAPPELRQVADLQADLLNIAPEKLSKFGGKHVDSHDSDAGVTCMVTDSDINEDSEEWGYFVICDLGIAIELRSFCVICFCSLHYHRGFMPTAKKGHVPKPWSYHYTIVLYPSAPLLEGTSQVEYAALPKNNEFPLAPEMILPWYVDYALLRIDDQSTRVNHATWLCEGALFTPAVMFLQWFFQTIIQIIFYFMQQIPSNLDIQVDFDHLAECFSVKDPANPTMRIMAQPWKYCSDDTQARNEAIQDHESFALTLLLWEGRHGVLHHSASALSIKSYSTNLHTSGCSTAQALAEANTLTSTSTVDRSRARKVGVRRSTRHNKPLPVEWDSTHKHRSQMSHVLVKPLT
ncbi:hypothetical protein V8D89_006623 [Ganoderma adspersum]